MSELSQETGHTLILILIILNNKYFYSNILMLIDVLERERENLGLIASKWWHWDQNQV